MLKDADRGSLLRVIRTVARGEALLGPSIAQRVLEQFTTPPSPPPPPQPSNAPARKITERLVISEKTVGNHISNIFAKLQVNDRSQAILRALQGAWERVTKKLGLEIGDF